MSLILEALKKSDAERQRVRERPSAASAPVHRSGRTAMVLTVAILLSLAAGWLLSGIWPRWPGEAAGPSASVEPVAATTGAAVLPRDPPPAVQPVGEPVAEDTISISPTVLSDSVATGESAAGDTDGSASETVIPERPSKTVASQPPAPAASVDLTRGDPPRSGENVGKDDAEPVGGPVWHGDPELIQSVAEAATESEVYRSDPRDRIPQLGQLPASVRAAIGDLTLNIHVYAEQPAERFVLINLKRYSEGEALNASLRVEAIRDDGVVLEYGGQLFLLASQP